ncbi:(d)CMP kinase [Buchnera aphidicola]|uniref:(d)CMP kinase n=1 Tax=Buchnera aphidicola TaxID=9 RepID=UPI0001BC69BE|nr:(d)CMP kinase [Buchnera aphidicola]ADP66130.1 cytidylate kinase [Buchnera aphidicola str. LL01 (Acyrthosiphon pisum)]ADP67284.1 cytidylate kinase [Buchnera aphidicola str. JF99 (Acyrthosiphon pisum)]ADP67808.1 cytidylate kinase [Buchnera aphidicola str. JF98 (Acyrthosiphon pisum)]OQX99510.1 MAG: cytidylate kinase [Erwiniaceae bacterium 4572_131]
MINHIPVVTIDGPSGVGKSSLSKIIANKLNWSLLESGQFYRLLAFLVLNKNITMIEKNIVNLLDNLDYELIKKKLLIIFISQKI